MLAYYSFVGFETSVNVAEETRDPRRSYPRALFGALITAGAVYALVGAAAAAAVPTDRLVSSSGPLLEVVREAGGVPTELFGAVALVAVANGALLTGIMSSRLAYGMARDRLLPGFLTKVLPGRRTPWAAIAATTALSLLLALTGDVATLASTLVLLLLVVFFMVNTATLVLRRRDTTARPDHFRAPTAVPLLGAASCVAHGDADRGRGVAEGPDRPGGRRGRRRRGGGTAAAGGVTEREGRGALILTPGLGLSRT